MSNIKFNELGLAQNIIDQIEKKNFLNPTEIQQKAIPAILNGDQDILAIASTGTGKTAAFGLPIIDRIDKNQKSITAIILTPTRELAIQVAGELDSYKSERNIHIAAIYGGQSITKQNKILAKGLDIIVGTPGRIIDNIKRGAIKLHDVKYLVLDEADEMLNMGFIEDIEFILKSSNKDKRIFLFSATLPHRIKNLSKKYMNDQLFIEVKKKDNQKLLIEQSYFILKQQEKFDQLKKIADIYDNFYAIIFCRTKRDVDDLVQKLQNHNYKAEGVHGDFSQNIREKTINKFRGKKIQILVATDVAARGIDIESLNYVINFSLPDDLETYIHRIGRTGRAGKTGKAISFLSFREKRRIHQIERMTKSILKKENFISDKEYKFLKEKKFLQNLENKILAENFSKESEEVAKNLLKKYDSWKVVASLI
jgi:ATP-dependent RNA helicase DeaD